MPAKLDRWLMTFGVVLATYAVLWFTWVGAQQLVLSLGVMAVGVWAVARVQWAYSEPAVTAPAPAEGPDAPAAGPVDDAPDWRPVVLALAGLACAGAAYGCFLHEHWGYGAAFLGAGALAWRGGLPLRLPELPRPALIVALLLALGAGAAFRLHKVGVVPVGFCALDEAVLKMMDQDLVNGQRPTMLIMPGISGDGALPYYMAAFSMKVFGESMTGFRLGAALVGIFVVLIMFHLCRDKGGAWLGLAAALLWAVCVWPVSISRAHYLLVETHMVVLACLAFLVKALQKDKPIYFALAGFAWAFTFQVYHAAQVMAPLVPLLIFLTWYFQPKQRDAIARGLVPMLAGLLVGLGPLLLWAWTDPKDAYLGTFGVLYASHIGGASASMGPVAALDALLGRAIPMFPLAWKMFTVRGPFQSYFFPEWMPGDAAYPVFNQSVLLLFLVGVSVSLARFRRPYFSFLLFWWAAALLPGLISNPGSQPDDRRMMMVMPPTLILAGLGLVTSIGFLLRALPGRARTAAFIVVGGAYFAYLSPLSWHDYFSRNQGNHQLLNYGMANTTEQARAIYEESKKGSVVLISTQGLNFDSWNQPNYDPFNRVYPALCTFPTFFAQHSPEYYANEGLFSAFKWAQAQPVDPSGKRPDILVALTPFHFYLEPLLLKLGGKVVREVKQIETNTGPLEQGVGMAPAVGGLSMKLIRLPVELPGLAALREASLFHFSAEELLPPGSDRAPMSQQLALGPEIKKALTDYQEHPGRWRANKAVLFGLPDPWFWMTPGNLPTGIRPPLRLKVSFKLNLKEAGAYAFGASATPYTTLKLDGRPVYTFMPITAEAEAAGLWIKERNGELGAPLSLKAGAHRLDVEQVWLSDVGNYNHTLRVLWKAPYGEKETLPLEVLEPVPGVR